MVNMHSTIILHKWLRDRRWPPTIANTIAFVGLVGVMMAVASRVPSTTRKRRAEALLRRADARLRAGRSPVYVAVELNWQAATLGCEREVRMLLKTEHYGAGRFDNKTASTTARSSANDGQPLSR